MFTERGSFFDLRILNAVLTRWKEQEKGQVRMARR